MRQEPTPRPATVTELLDLITGVMAENTNSMELTGTISGFRQRPRWSYGELVTYEAGSNRIESKIRLTFPPGSLPSARLDLDGAEVTLFGKVTIHRLFGPLQFNVRRLSIVDQESSAVRATIDLRASIEADGLHMVNKRLHLPSSADTLTLICPTGGGAGGADFFDRLRVGGHPWNIDTIEVPMSGNGAVHAICEAIARGQRSYSQAVVICRGGGAATDLLAFDSSKVAHAIVSSTAPVIVAVGHATDAHVADLVAHTSLPTPSAAASWLNERRGRALQQAESLATRAAQAKAVSAEATALRESFAAATAQDQSSRRERHASMAIAAAAFVIAVALIVIAAVAL